MIDESDNYLDIEEQSESSNVTNEIIRQEEINLEEEKQK